MIDEELLKKIELISKDEELFSKFKKYVNKLILELEDKYFEKEALERIKRIEEGKAQFIFEDEVWKLLQIDDKDK